jgi:hypothetical protein
LAREKAVDGVAMNAKHSTDAHSVEPAVVDQAPDGFGMHAELRRNLSDADQSPRFSAYRRHNPREALQVRAPRMKSAGSRAPGLGAPRSNDESVSSTAPQRGQRKAASEARTRSR